jgi:hypothetical protein
MRFSSRVATELLTMDLTMLLSLRSCLRMPLQVWPPLSIIFFTI